MTENKNSAMELFNRQAFMAYLSTFPATTFSDQWHSCVAKVGDKMFAAFGEGGLWQDDIVIKTTPESYEILCQTGIARKAPYASGGQWLAIHANNELTSSELKAYIARSFALVTSGMTKKKRRELGLDQ